MVAPFSGSASGSALALVDWAVSGSAAAADDSASGSAEPPELEWQECLLTVIFQSFKELIYKSYKLIDFIMSTFCRVTCANHKNLDQIDETLHLLQQ